LRQCRSCTGGTTARVASKFAAANVSIHRDKHPHSPAGRAYGDQSHRDMHTVANVAVTDTDTDTDTDKRTHTCMDRTVV
jgi:hypothetical protein